MKSLFWSLLNFLKNPKYTENNLFISNKKRFFLILFIFPILGFIISSCLWWFVTLLRDLNFFTLIETDFNSKRGLYFNLAITVIFTPIIEEMLFRFPIKYLPKNKLYGPLIYFNILVFGLVHFINYETNFNGIIFALIIVSPQIFIGFLLTYIRISYGLRYSIITHSIYNFLGFTFLYLI